MSLPVKSGGDQLIGVLMAFPVMELCTPVSPRKAWLPRELKVPAFMQGDLSVSWGSQSSVSSGVTHLRLKCELSQEDDDSLPHCPFTSQSVTSWPLLLLMTS